MSDPIAFSATVVALQESLAAALAERDKARALMLSFIGSLSLADNLADVAGDIWTVLERIKMKPPEEVGDLNELGTWLGMDHGVRTLYDTPLVEDED
ncbi:hypothetical protein LAV_00164 [Sphingobium phage Lacusarx]|uniref:Uncharacterized protein n=1 Tax=Sphingobium phage Lacusarx TaxID=1980139 RepID=A0A1W6DXC8_9CAUD|nr:hypothetical protein FDH44_gp139 [Sphingobium phage Lacusarx]ARK07539.1 hypothetical protein LAV_00164 [Sphingobium phage Lacusarx]